MLFIYLFIDRISLCCAGWTETHYVEQDHLKLIEIHLSQPPRAGIKDM